MHKAKWVDTWHGVGVEHASGIGRAKMLKSYDIGFISSEFFMEYYESKQKGISDKLRITGYPRTDPLLNGSLNKKWILKSMDIPEGKQIILYAPSWEILQSVKPQRNHSFHFPIQNLFFFDGTDLPNLSLSFHNPPSPQLGKRKSRLP
jgi:hypothetical protein